MHRLLHLLLGRDNERFVSCIKIARISLVNPAETASSIAACRRKPGISHTSQVRDDAKYVGKLQKYHMHNTNYHTRTALGRARCIKAPVLPLTHNFPAHQLPVNSHHYDSQAPAQWFPL